MTLRILSLLALATLAVIFTATPVFAGGSGDPASAPLFAGYWNEFLDHWTGVFQQQNGIVMGALVIGAVCLFIITRGKWKK